EDRLFGSVTSQNIHEALIEKGIEIDRHAILLEEPIKALGIYDIPVKITKGLNQEVKVYVIQA
ncbi:MAG: 50S ribosomal L9 C-terminal domain-containing protein, partial [bacterium]